MTSFPNSPRLLKGGIVLIDPDTSAVRRIIVLQYNPDTLSRTLQPQAVKESDDRSEAMRLTGPPVETIKLDAEIDATDQLRVSRSESERDAVWHSAAACGVGDDRLSGKQPALVEQVDGAGEHVGDSADDVGAAARGWEKWGQSRINVRTRMTDSAFSALRRSRR